MDAKPQDVEGITPVHHPHISHTNNTLAPLRAILSNLYFLLVQAQNHQGAGTTEAMKAELRQLITNLSELSLTSKRLPTRVPVELMQYVEEKRNPDVYKRQIVEMVMQYNQIQNGKAQAFADFRDILGRELMSAIPDIREDVKLVVENTGGRVD